MHVTKATRVVWCVLWLCAESGRGPGERRLVREGGPDGGGISFDSRPDFGGVGTKCRCWRAELPDGPREGSRRTKCRLSGAVGRSCARRRQHAVRHVGAARGGGSRPPRDRAPAPRRDGCGGCTAACTSSGRWRPSTAGAMAAVLALGDGAVLSHDAAAGAVGTAITAEGPIDVTVAGRETRSRAGIRIAPPPSRPPGTRPASTASPSPARPEPCSTSPPPSRHATLDRAVEQAQVQRQVSLHSLNEQFRRYPTHRGTRH